MLKADVDGCPFGKLNRIACGSEDPVDDGPEADRGVAVKRYRA